MCLFKFEKDIPAYLPTYLYTWHVKVEGTCFINVKTCLTLTTYSGQEHCYLHNLVQMTYHQLTQEKKENYISVVIKKSRVWNAEVVLLPFKRQQMFLDWAELTDIFPLQIRITNVWLKGKTWTTLPSIMLTIFQRLHL